MFSKTRAFAFVSVCAFHIVLFIKADTFNECEGVNANTYVFSSDSCSVYILCDDDDSVQYECAEDQYFDIENESCDDKQNVFCPLDNNEGEGGEGSSEDSSEGSSEESTTVAPSSATTELSNATLPTTPFEIIDIPPIIKDACPADDDPKQIVYVTSSKLCSDYFVCYHGHPLEMHCTDHLHFNALTGKCDFPENSNCKITNQPPSATNKCLPHITDFFPHPQKCNYFFYCIKGYQTLQQCPFYYGWDIERRTCVHMAHVKCYDNTH